ncbi:MBL fold metallo-hydrolase [Chromobacterium vaccinii]|uniref:MBL fold metallo-hydrolase n=1 Tax=Chromobacterium vaccinii TaxID=1108595 RepID=UPI000E15F975|nr:MBL fold metallo-hydrolase [Chromobacterium vaccinii]SUX29430.1 Probable polyketide biosynthesis zinc-dependent hydrolase BaeB [Chromobacterium vaccinii]
MTAQIASFFDAATGTISHIVYDRPGGCAAAVDPVLDFDFRSGRTSRASADRLLAFLAEQRLTLQWILETHAHADHLSAAPYLKQQAGGRVAIGARIVEVQAIFRRVFNLEPAFRCDGSQFDHLFQDGETFRIGELEARVIALPGHTPADVGYQIGDAVFVGDTLFMPDVGTARCDFPGGDPAELYRSIRKLLALPADTRLLMCHDYPRPGASLPGARPWRSSAPPICTPATASTKPPSSRCAPRATRRWRCRNCCCRRCKSTSAPACRRRPTTTGSAI